MELEIKGVGLSEFNYRIPCKQYSPEQLLNLKQKKFSNSKNCCGNAFS